MKRSLSGYRAPVPGALFVRVFPCGEKASLRRGKGGGPAAIVLLLLLCHCAQLAAQSQFSQSQYSQFQLSTSRIESIAAQSQWLRLLHYERGGGRGTFAGRDFYLSPRGRKDARAELMATLQALQRPVRDARHPRCRFPARYYFLARVLGRPELREIPPACQRLRRWLRRDRIRSVGLLLVSGYMGNPASLFGHSVIRLDTAGERNGLFDTTINYGALVPPREHVVAYVVKGIFGGYQAGYSDQFFYTQDMVYTHTEARDIWEYELRLNPAQLELLQRHLWEIMGKKKRYFFLSRNCAYELGRSLEVVLDEPLMGSARLWYTPVELFNDLLDLDERRKRRGESGLIAAVRYHPSAERRLIHHYRRLEAPLRQRARDFLAHPSVAQARAGLAGLDAGERRRLLDFLLSYHYFRYLGELPEVSATTRELKHALLVERLQLPPSAQEQAPAPRPSPTAGTKPLVLGAGIVQYPGDDQRPLWNLTAFSREPSGRNALEGGELTVFDLRLSLRSERPVVQQLDYLRILHHALSPLPGSSEWSWRIQLRSLMEQDGGYDHQFYFSIGKSKQAGRAMLYTFLTPSLHSTAPYLRLRPEVGMLYRWTEALRSHVRLGLENGRRDVDWVGSAVLQYVLSRSWSLKMDFQREPEALWRVALRRHW